ncbi:VOC family protein [Alkalicoccus halolimnae]|uniref:VOC family protein n=1 Tax=Alkalicoccus halolimnae TaxID=1667239 RepID=A0A5C7FL85_9BACI|nr:VOC family protein [Alkalicoccus halolimnae]TXF86146.1 VOC family protein [Alkalicoccus halolimnae]
MPVDVYINFNGNCREAVEFYAEVFQTEEPQFMTFGEAPPDPDYSMPEEADDLIMHTRLVIEGSTVMFSDLLPSMPFEQGNNISLAVLSKDEAALRSYFSKLQEGGRVNMELQKTFWSNLYGSVTDKFGIEWQVSHDSEG